MNTRWFKLYRAYSISFTSANNGKFFGSWLLKDCIELQEKKKKIAVFYPCPPQNVKLIRTFHVVIVQRRQRNVQKRVMHVHCCCFANLNLLLFCRSRSRRRRRCLSSLISYSPPPPPSSTCHAGYKKCLKVLCFYSPYRQNVWMLVHRRVDIHADKSLVPIYTYLSWSGECQSGTQYLV